MSNYNTTLQSNNTDIQALINKVNALPEAVNIDAELSTQDNLIAQIQAAVDNLPDAGGGGNINIGTCNVTYTNTSSLDITAKYLTVIDGNVTLQTTNIKATNGEGVLKNVVKDSYMSFVFADTPSDSYNINFTKSDNIVNHLDLDKKYYYIFSANGDGLLEFIPAINLDDGWS